MFKQIENFFRNDINKLCLLSSVLLISLIISGFLRMAATDVHEAQIEALTEVNQNILTDMRAKVHVLELANDKLQKLNIALLSQLDTKAEQVADVKTYIISTSKTICPDVAGVIAENVVNNGIKYNVPVATIVSVMEVESHFNFQAVGGVGERGLMQVRFKVWHKKLNIKSKYDLHNIAIGVEKGVQVLGISLRDCKFDLKKAIRQFNSGSTSRGSAVYVANVMKSMSEYTAHTSLRQVIKDQQKKEAAQQKATQSDVMVPES